MCLLILLSALLSNALLNITSSSVQVQKRLGSTTDSRRVLIVVTISFRRMKTAAALRKEEADEEKRRRKTQNERKTLTIQIFYFLRDGCRDTSIITTIIRSIFRLERVEINLLGFFLLLFQVKLFVGHDSFYAMMRVIFCRLSQKRGELEKKRTSLSV